MKADIKYVCENLHFFDSLINFSCKISQLPAKISLTEQHTANVYRNYIQVLHFK